jgi:lysophospholipase L1-like esterase
MYMMSCEPYVFNETQLQSRYIDDFRRWAEEDVGRLPMRDALLCVGSSTLRRWEGIKEDLGPGLVLNRGFGGSRMADVIPFAEFFARYEAEKVLVYEGDNDLGDGTKDVAELMGEFRIFCEAIWARRADVRIYIIAIKPCPSRWRLRNIYLDANEQLRALCDTDERLTYIDVDSVMLGDDGTPIPEFYIEDNLHMTRTGYELWRDVIHPILEDN